jgi:hypothetical protein
MLSLDLTLLDIMGNARHLTSDRERTGFRASSNGDFSRLKRSTCAMVDDQSSSVLQLGKCAGPDRKLEAHPHPSRWWLHLLVGAEQ